MEIKKWLMLISELVCLFVIHRLTLILTYLDVFVNSWSLPSLYRLLLVHACFWFLKTTSLLPDFIMILNLLAFLISWSLGSCSLTDLEFAASEALAFVLSSERLRQRRLVSHRDNSSNSSPIKHAQLNLRPDQPVILTQPLLSPLSHYYRNFGVLDVHCTNYSSLKTNTSQFGNLNILLLHQFGSASFTFDELGSSLSTKPHLFESIIAFDRPGHGKTNRPSGSEPPKVLLGGDSVVEVYSPECAIRLCKLLADPGPTIIVGCGAGALLALKVAVRVLLVSVVNAIRSILF